MSNRICFRVPDKLMSEMKECMNEKGITSMTEFVKNAIRYKIEDDEERLREQCVIDSIRGD